MKMRPGDHRSVTYSDEAELEPVLAPFLSEGLAGSDKVLYFTDITHPAIVTGLLRAWGVGPDAYIADGRLDVRQMETSDPDLLVNHLAEAARQARAQGYRALRVTGEMSWAVREGTARLAAYETKVQSLFDTGLAMGICQYDRRLFQPVVLAELQRIHQGRDMDLEFDGALMRIRRTVDPPGIRVEGEVDANTLGELNKALSSAVLREPGDVHVHLGEVSFIDLSGLRALVDTAGAIGDGRSLVLDPVPEHVLQLIKLIGWDGTPGLRLHGGDPR
ncbi:MEDS domain-containing protein [Planotetraspora sp. GP83]|uniref:MEDS domain-containing protein n=1 Tax=Planotetraspora sp. GP83 TaxID=3156264 RepID=UPI003515BAF5